jgi:two-component system, cell cycle sensor histidine kinase and response regulator CckA
MKPGEKRIPLWIKTTLSGWPSWNWKLFRKIRSRKEAETALVDSEEKFRLVFESANVGKSITLPAGEMDVNKAFCDMLGYTRKELRNIRWQDMTPSDEIDSTQAFLDQLLQGKKDSVRFNKRYIHKNGSPVWTDVSVAIYRDSHRNPLLLIATIVDISERKRAEEAIRTEQLFTKALLDSLPGIFYLYTYPELRLVRWNKNHETLLGFGPGEIDNRSIMEWHVPEAKEAVRQAIETVMKRGQNIIESPLLTKDGRPIPFLMTGVRFEMLDKLYLMGVGIDITERKKAEAALAEEVIRRRILIEQSSDGIVVLDQNGRVYEANKQFAHMLGYSPEEVSRLHVWDWDTQWSRDQLLDMIRSVDESGAHLETRHRRKDGGLIDVEISSNGAVYGGQKLVFCVCRDISQRKRIEEKLREDQFFLKRSQEIGRIGSYILQIPRDEPESQTWTSSEIMDDIFGIDKNYPRTGENWLKLIVQRDKVSKYFSDMVFTECRRFEMEYQIKRPRDGKMRWIYGVGDLEFDATGKPLRMIGAVQDITERKESEEVLRQKTALLEAQLNSSIEGILVVDAQGKKVLQNQRAIDLWKIPKHIVDDINDQMQIDHVMHMTKNPGQFVDKIVYLYNHPDETSRDEVELTDGTVLDRYSAPVLGKDGKCYGRIWTFRDITNRKRVEEALRESETIFSRFMEYSPIYVFFKDENIRTIRLSKNYETMLGKPLTELLGKTMDEIFPSELAKSIIADDMKILKEGNEITVEEEFNGRFYTTIKFPIHIDGKPRYLAGYTIDNTAHKQAEEALKEREKEFRRLSQEFHGLLDAIPDSLMLLDKNRTVLWANKGAAKGIGKTLDEIVGQHCFALWYGLTSPCDPCPVARSFAEGIPVNVTVTRPDNRVWDLRTVPLIDEEGRTVSVIEVKRDITEHNKLEEQLRQAQKIEAVGQLAGGVAHDFNNILSAIMGYGHLMLMKMQENDPLRANVKEILDASQRAAVLTQSLLAFSRKQVVNLARIDLNTLVQRFEKFMLRLLREDIELKIICAKQLLNVMVDSAQIEQVLMNLVMNAKDAMPDGGQLTIETRLATLDEEFMESYSQGRAGEYALLLVTDTGVGMNENTKEKAFEPFFTTKEVGRGTGLGLAMVYGIVKKHNGYIFVYSEIGHGTTFKIYLPLAEATPAEARKKEQVSAPAQGGTETVLVVEDDPIVRKLTTTVLKQFGYTVLEAIDGEDAIFQYVEYKDQINLVILDAIMPKKNGWQVYEEIRTITPGVRVLFMSGYSEDIFSANNITEKGLVYLLKPASPTELLKKVREVLDTKSA